MTTEWHIAQLNITTALYPHDDSRIPQHPVTLDDRTGKPVHHLGENPLTADPDMLKDIPIIKTIARGRTVYRRDSTEKQNE